MVLQNVTAIIRCSLQFHKVKAVARRTSFPIRCFYHIMFVAIAYKKGAFGLEFSHDIRLT